MSTYAADRPLIWTSGDGRHALIEATSAQHLDDDVKALGVGFPDYDPDDTSVWAVAFSAWERLSVMGLRVLTLLEGGGPVATFSYSPSERRMAEYKCQTPSMLSLTADQLHVPRLCAAFHALRGTLPMNAMPNAIARCRTDLLSPLGTWVAATFENACEAVAGRFVAPADILAEDLARLCRNRMLQLDVSALGGKALENIPADCLAHLRTDAASVALPHLRQGGLTALQAKVVRLAAHEDGAVSCEEAAIVELPAHRIGDVRVGTPENLILPVMDEGDIISSCEEVVLPSLRKGNVMCHAATSLEVPKLRVGSVECEATWLRLPAFEIGGVVAEKAAGIDAPVLEVGSLSLEKATSLAAPKLRHADITADALRVVELPELVGGNLSFGSAEIMLAPKMRKGLLRAPMTTKPVLAPDHRVSIMAARTEEVTVPGGPRLH